MMVLAAVLGLVCGSFVNVWIARIPAGEQWVKGASHCPRCRHELVWYDNIPLVSWLLLRGRCRYCSEPISAQYPLVELATGALFVGAYWRFGWSVLFVVLAYVAMVSVALSVIDARTRRLPRSLTYPSYPIIALGVIVHAMVEGDAWIVARACIGMAAVGGFYTIMWLLVPHGMGRGDAVTAGFLGLVLGAVGWPAVAVGAIAGPLVGGVAGIVAIIRQRRSRGIRIAYGPWLIGGAWIGILGGQAIGDWYLDAATMGLR